MRPDDFDAELRRLELYHTLRVVPDAWAVLRVDGRSFSRFTESRFDKPFDPRMSALMRTTAEALLVELGGLYAYTESDEISVLLARDFDLFDRELEKLVSISAAIASSTFSLAAGERACFDSRVWVGVTDQRVVDYFLWRQADATRCALNGWCYWTLRKEGQTVAQATAALEGQSVGWKNELLFQRGINFNELPAWQRRGVGLRWETYDKPAVNPKTGEEVTAQRRRVAVVDELPMKEEYARWLRGLLGISD